MKKNAFVLGLTACLTVVVGCNNEEKPDEGVVVTDSIYVDGVFDGNNKTYSFKALSSCAKTATPVFVLRSGSVLKNVKISGYNSAVQVEGDNVQLQNVTVASKCDFGVQVDGVNNIKISDLTLESSNSNVLVYDSSNVVINNVKTSNIPYPIDLNNSASVTVTNSNFSGFTTAINAVKSGLEVKQTTFKTGKTGVKASDNSGVKLAMNNFSSVDTKWTADSSSTIEEQVPQPGSYWKPEMGKKWHIQFSGNMTYRDDIDYFNLDTFDTKESVIRDLKAKGKKIICYFSVGTYENWRPDKHKFPSSVIGKPLADWEGENWLDVRALDVLLPIMRARMELAASKGCDAVDPDNADGYTNNPGFPMDYDDQLVYLKHIADIAHSLGLAIGLKNNLLQIEDLVDDFDFAFNESCFVYNECEYLLPFIAQGKPVFGIEYVGSTSSFCPRANAWGFDFVKKQRQLNEFVEFCRK